MSNRRLLLFILAGFLAGVLITAGVVALTDNSGSLYSTYMSNRNMRASIQSMMGVSNENSLPLKKSSNTKAVLEPTIASGGVKEFALTAEAVRWQYTNGQTILAWGYNGRIPGPEIRVTEGDKVRIKFTNSLPKATSIHWHGLNVPNNMDGVPGVTQDAIQPGKSFTYEFTAGPAGTHFYHAHGSGHDDEAQQSDMGLNGAFIVEPVSRQKPDREYTLVLDDWQKGNDSINMAMQDMDMGANAMNMTHMMNYNLFTINGLSFPDTTPLDVKRGDKVRVRLINASASTIHPMHLHGHQFKIVAEDGNAVPEAAQLTKNTVALNPGETYDIEFTADNPGLWAFHCHELHHAGAGMISLLKYEGYNVPDTTKANSSDDNGGNMMMDHSMHGM